MYCCYTSSYTLVCKAEFCPLKQCHITATLQIRAVYISVEVILNSYWTLSSEEYNQIHFVFQQNLEKVLNHMFKRKNGAERNGVSFPDAYTQCHDHFH